MCNYFKTTMAGVPFFSGADWNDFLPPRWISCPLGPVRAIADLHCSPLYLRAFDKLNTRCIWIKHNFERSLCALTRKPILKKLTLKKSTFWARPNSQGIKALIFGDCLPLPLLGDAVPALLATIGREKRDLTPGRAEWHPSLLAIFPNTSLLHGSQIQEFLR